MKINGLNGANSQVGGMNMMKATDSVSKNIQNQISNAQKQLQEISANKDMSIEEKMKKRQEIQQQINDLNNQLRQHQIEQRKEKVENARKQTKRAPKVGKKSSGLSQASMKAMLYADSAMAQAQVQGSVATQMEGRAGVLESEIKLDSARGGDVSAKKEELEEVKQKVAAAETAQMNTLADASKKMEEATKEETQTEKTDAKDKKADKKEAVSDEKQDMKVTENEEIVVTNEISADVAENAEVSAQENITYTHVDVRL